MQSPLGPTPLARLPLHLWSPQKPNPHLPPLAGPVRYTLQEKRHQMDITGLRCYQAAANPNRPEDLMPISETRGNQPDWV